MLIIPPAKRTGRQVVEASSHDGSRGGHGLRGAWQETLKTHSVLTARIRLIAYLHFLTPSQLGKVHKHGLLGNFCRRVIKR